MPRLHSVRASMQALQTSCEINSAQRGESFPGISANQLKTCLAWSACRMTQAI
jgi:hypothetical protein